VTWAELKELIPSLSDDDIKLFQDVFGFLLVTYVPPSESQSLQGHSSRVGMSVPQTFIFFKHASFKKAVKETIEVIKNDQTRA